MASLNVGFVYHLEIILGLSKKMEYWVVLVQGFGAVYLIIDLLYNGETYSGGLCSMRLVDCIQHNTLYGVLHLLNTTIGL